MNKQVSNHLLKDYLRDFSHDRLSLFLCCVGLSVLIIVYFVFYQKRPLQIFPDNKNTSVRFYNDNFDNGNSSIESFIISDSVISLDFILRKGFVRPYVGIGITFPESVETDISGYNQLQIEAQGKDVNTILVYLVMNDSGVANIPGKFPLQYFGDIIEVSSECKTFRMELKHFKVPDWWFDVNNFSPSINITPNWKRLVDINISNGLTPSLDKEKTLSIYSITFSRNNNRTILYMLMIQVGIICFVFFVFVFRNNPLARISPITINYKAVNSNDKIKLDNSFLDYINNNFQDSDLTLKKVSKYTSIQARHIAEAISDKYGCNFKTYINKIRINEAQRLLRETTLHNNEIAYKVGFSSPSQFNRVFKNLTGKNPSEYLQNPLG